MRTHFEQQFNEPVDPPAIDTDFLQDIPRLSSTASLHAPLRDEEVAQAINGMRWRAGSGPFGLEIGVLQRLIKVPQLLGLLRGLLQSWLLEDQQAPLLLSALLTAIPKRGKPPDTPRNLRPISVLSVWYRIVMRIFVQRLSPLLPGALSSEQQGFCPGRSCVTGLASLLPVLEAARPTSPVVLVALDIHKAYDQIHRGAMQRIMEHIGLGDTAFWRLYCTSQAGETYLTGGGGLSEPFSTSRGIKQGCPFSPVAFALLLSGL